VASGSDLAKWYASAATALPESTTTHDLRVLPTNREVWSTPHSLWIRIPDMFGNTEQLSIFFPPDQCELPGGMVVCRDSATVSKPDTTRPPTPDPTERPPQPKAGHCPQPNYPSVSITAGVEAKVVVEMYVDRKGVVRKWFFLRINPVGWGFARAVEDVIADWNFVPAIQRGEPVGVWVAVPFNFRVRR
jgi:hypothetical protein